MAERMESGQGEVRKAAGQQWAPRVDSPGMGAEVRGAPIQSCPKSPVQQHVKEMRTGLDLHQDTWVGGQRRWTPVASELLTFPPCMRMVRCTEGNPGGQRDPLCWQKGHTAASRE